VAYKLSPVANMQQFFDNNGYPLSGGKLFTYAGGSSSIMVRTWRDDQGNTSNSNPIVMDSSGRQTAEIWLLEGYEYNFVLTKADGTTVLQTVDGIIT